jgi:hypothetical protein
MALDLDILPCISNPAHHLHPPPSEQSLRIQIEGPLVSIQKLLPKIPWHTDITAHVFPQPVAIELAKLAYRKVYGRDIRPEVAGDLVVRDEYLGWVMEEGIPIE